MNIKIVWFFSLALMVLGVCALLVANPGVLGGFSSTVNGVPVEVLLSPSSDEPIKTMRSRDLRRNWADHVGKFVRFTGVVEYAEKSYRTEKIRRLRLEDFTTEVYPLDAPTLPKSYERGHKYEFTGFLIRYEAHAKFKESGYVKNRVYAFEIRHLGEAD